ncbi:carboxyl transferase domain-containing protein [Streptomyces sp. NPDC016845]|uniref:carboxyl transferase domain-containing protein n=1 Tax=Streptomyces sp. NPDC016845 TaxID=3364972 RepID=UPI0037929B4F
MAEGTGARAVLATVCDPDTFRELAPPAPPARPDPLRWPGYGDAKARATERTGEAESVVTGTAEIDGAPAVVVAFEFGYLGGSLGQETGDRIEAAHVHARAHRLPLVPLIATGGSRMQEGMIALTQLQRVARQSALTRAAGLPQIAVVRDPTTGGGWATLGAGADLTLALPGAQIGFAGSRVRPPGADPAAYTAQAQWEAGSVDTVVAPDELRAALGRRLRLLTRPSAASKAPAPVPYALGRTDLPTTGWEAVERARAPQRPRAAAYLDAYFTDRVELRGDRAGGTDDGMLCGFGAHEAQGRSRTIAYAAQCGTATTPAGYRTATRLVRLAGRLGIPVLTLVDTPGAASGDAAERAGAGAAIAELFLALAESPVPLTTLVIGEGGSGGALALAAPGNTWVAPDAYFSVIAPELAAAILKRPADLAPVTAGQLRLRPQDLVDLGVVRGIAEPPPAATPAP